MFANQTENRLEFIFFFFLIKPFGYAQDETKKIKAAKITPALRFFFQNTIKDPHWYAVQVSDTTMMIKAASLPGQ